MSGESAAWGLVNRYCCQATANMWNDKGGVEIDGELYRIEIVSADDRNDPKLTVSGAEMLTASEGIRYFIGPNTDSTAASARPVAEKSGAMYIPYAFDRALYAPPASNAILGMITTYQAAPIAFRLLGEQRGVRKVGFLTRNDSDSLLLRGEGVKISESLGYEVVAQNDTYEGSTTDFYPIVGNVVNANPDLIHLPAASPAHAPQIMRAAREMGYQGLFFTDATQDIKIINEIAGEYGDGLVTIGGASTPEIRSAYMESFMEYFSEVAGEWNDEAGTKVYALEMILMTLQKAGSAAIDDVEAFKAEIDEFSVPNPFLKEEQPLGYVGMADFGQKRQIGLPMVITETKGGEWSTLAIGEVAS